MNNVIELFYRTCGYTWHEFFMDSIPHIQTELADELAWVSQRPKSRSKGEDWAMPL